MTVYFEKSQYPQDSEGNYQGWLKRENGEYLDGEIKTKTNTFIHTPAFGLQESISLEGAIETNVKEQWQTLARQAQNFEDFWDQG